MSVISDFFDERLKKKSKEEVVESIFSALEQCHFATHIGKLTNPDVKTNLYVQHGLGDDDVVATETTQCMNDGYYPNASIMAPMTLLYKHVEDGRTVLEHLTADTEFIRNELAPYFDDYDAAREKLLSVTPVGEAMQTDNLLKQTYFPVDDGEYHLLSAVTSSSMIFEIKKRIDKMRENETLAKNDGKNDKRESSDLPDVPREYEKIPNLIFSKFGGTKPQNISAMVNEEHGNAYLLPCFPPTIDVAHIKKPRHDFFREVLRPSSFNDDFDAIKKLFLDEKNNLHIRRRRIGAIDSTMKRILYYADVIRGQDAGWSDDEQYEHLPKSQKIWLDERYSEERESDAWRKDVARALALWLTKHIVGKNKETIFDDRHLDFIKARTAKLLKEW